MREYLKFYIDGAWVQPSGPDTLDVINPADGSLSGRIASGTEADVDLAVRAAQRASGRWAATTRDARLELLQRIVEEYRRRQDDFAEAFTAEMGAPAALARGAQFGSGLGHLQAAIEVLRSFEFDAVRGTTRIVKEPIGVCGLITPWNWPMNQIACKVAPALATGCTVVLKPSEMAPFSACLFAEVLHAAGVPAGVFNLVNGTGPAVGGAIAAHRGVAMVSITGSNRAGIEVARAAAPTVKRVAQELGGKSPNLILDDADLDAAVKSNVRQLMGNSGQSCNALSRMLVPADRLDDAAAIARRAVEAISVGDPASGADLGPVVSQAQWSRIQELIASGIEQGATLVTGGLGRPAGLEAGCYVKPTVFTNVTNDMRIAREEIFGPVLAILPYRSVDEAVEIANDTDYGLSAAVWGADLQRVHDVASRLRAGRVGINGAGGDLQAPFGGYKHSGNGREWGEYGFHEFLEVKAMLGFAKAGH